MRFVLRCQVPSVIVGAQTDYEVEVKLRTSTLHTSFTVNLLPDDPIRVTIVTDDDATEVVSGDHADFEKKIKGELYYRDEPLLRLTH